MNAGEAQRLVNLRHELQATLARLDELTPAAAGATPRLNLSRRGLDCGDETIDLTTHQFGILQLLLGEPDKVWTRRELMQRVWGFNNNIYLRCVDSHIYRLRQRLGPYGRHIVSAHGRGYRWEANKEITDGHHTPDRN